jgi:hypothetical protein
MIPEKAGALLRRAGRPAHPAKQLPTQAMVGTAEICLVGFPVGKLVIRQLNSQPT